jgi:ABC-type transport system involved in cytochrome c biogenesis permease subunit
MKVFLLSFVVMLPYLALGADTKPAPSPKPGFRWDEISRMAILNKGRVKPLETYARETSQFVTGSTNWQGFHPVEIIFSWLTAFDDNWRDTAFIRIDHEPLKIKIGLNKDRKYFAPNELKDLSGMRDLVRTAMEKERGRERLDDIERKAVQLQNQMGQVEAIVRGDDLTILPNPDGYPLDDKHPWFSLSAMLDPGGKLPYSAELRNKLSDSIKPVLDAYLKGDAAAWNSSVPPLLNVLRVDLSRGNYPTEGAITREILYNDSRPFRWAWVAYTLAFILLLAFIVTNKAPLKIAGLSALALGYGIHVFGFALRCWIAGRPPVTNMYESVIWVTFGCVTFAWLVWGSYKNIIIPTAASVFAIVGLVLADNLPTVLDPNINTLTAVLRSNFWLTIHVLTITLSYAAFALSLCLGNVVMGTYLFRPGQTDRIQQITLYMYRAVQIGVVLLAAGTILGGVWADYSWGRFWGWDPKEVWALIALLLYLAVLHGRFAGWLKGFGFTAATVVCFLGVLMAWYGVNFWLGAGLHSYGFGAGGMTYVVGYIAAQVGFIIAAYVKYSRARKQQPLDNSIFPRPAR